MIKKSYTKTGNFCRVTFKLPPEVNAGSANICGEFNAWDPNARPMIQTKAGGFYITLSLPCRNSYRFKYLLDGEHWINDDHADEYVANEFGSMDSVVRL